MGAEPMKIDLRLHVMSFKKQNANLQAAFIDFIFAKQTLQTAHTE